MKLLRLPTVDGSTVAINPEHVVWIRKIGADTEINITDSAKVLVAVGFENVMCDIANALDCEGPPMPSPDPSSAGRYAKYPSPPPRSSGFGEF